MQHNIGPRAFHISYPRNGIDFHSLSLRSSHSTWCKKGPRNSIFLLGFQWIGRLMRSGGWLSAPQIHISVWSCVRYKCDLYLYKNFGYNQSINQSVKVYIQRLFKIPTQRRSRPTPSGDEQSCVDSKFDLYLVTLHNDRSKYLAQVNLWNVCLLRIYSNGRLRLEGVQGCDIIIVLWHNLTAMVITLSLLDIISFCLMYLFIMTLCHKEGVWRLALTLTPGLWLSTCKQLLLLYCDNCYIDHRPSLIHSFTPLQ